MSKLPQHIDELFDKEFWDSNLNRVSVHDTDPDDIKSFIATILDEVEGKREALAELEHEQWIAWSKNIAETENITLARLERWKKLWLPYSTLTEAEKDQDREWADKIINLIKEDEKTIL